MLLQENCKRIGIYAIYEKSGILNKADCFFLEHIFSFFARLLIVVNGELLEESKKKLNKYGEVLFRENEGFDITGYREGICYFGWDELKNYDELILFNNTMLGPVYPFAEMFNIMNNKDIDFWGMTMHAECLEILHETRYGYYPKHIQTYFTAVRSNMFASDDYKEYWMELPKITTYEEAVGFHEAVFTKYFSDLGYKYATLIEDEVLEKESAHPLMYNPVELFKGHRFPIFKKKLFYYDKTQHFLQFSSSLPAYEVVKFLDQQTSYDSSMAVESIIKTAAPLVLYTNMRNIFIVKNKKEVENLKGFGSLVIVIQTNEHLAYLEKLKEFEIWDKILVIYDPFIFERESLDELKNLTIFSFIEQDDLDNCLGLECLFALSYEAMSNKKIISFLDLRVGETLYEKNDQKNKMASLFAGEGEIGSIYETLLSKRLIGGCFSFLLPFDGREDSRKKEVNQLFFEFYEQLDLQTTLDKDGEMFLSSNCFHFKPEALKKFFLQYKNICENYWYKSASLEVKKKVYEKLLPHVIQDHFMYPVVAYEQEQLLKEVQFNQRCLSLYNHLINPYSKGHHFSDSYFALKNFLVDANKSLEKTLKEYSDVIDSYKEHYEQLKRELEGVYKKISALERELVSIKSTRSYKIINKIKKMLGRR